MWVVCCWGVCCFGFGVVMGECFGVVVLVVVVGVMDVVELDVVYLVVVN